MDGSAYRTISWPKPTLEEISLQMPPVSSGFDFNMTWKMMLFSCSGVMIAMGLW